MHAAKPWAKLCLPACALRYNKGCRNARARKVAKIFDSVSISQVSPRQVYGPRL